MCKQFCKFPTKSVKLTNKALLDICSNNRLKTFLYCYWTTMLNKDGYSIGKKIIDKNSCKFVIPKI